MLNLAKLLGRVSPDEYGAYRHKLPARVGFAVSKDDPTTLVITQVGDEILDTDKTLIMTQVRRDNSDAVHQIMDAAFTYLDIPEKLRPFYEKDYSLSESPKKQSNVLVKA
ncbi:MAG: hypothetical protein LBH36_02500 [Candidatus Nomurabacteria bacterium]|jgi:hypothetical protein|nr:hypothetical protein [Candidatus Nomurabacteria bacterium]